MKPINNIKNLDILIPFSKPPNHYQISNLPNHGLYHNKEKIIKIRENLFKLSINDISNFSDYVTRSSLNEKWIIDQIEYNNNNNNNIDYNLLTTTAIGNIAYLSLNSKEKRIRDICLSNLNNWLNFEKEKNKKRKKQIILGTFTFFCNNNFILCKKKNKI